MRKVMADWHQMCHKLSAERCQAKQSSINIQWLQIYWSLQIQILLVCESLFRTTVTSLNILTMTHAYTFRHTRNIYLSLNITNQIEKFNHAWNNRIVCDMKKFYIVFISSVVLYLITASTLSEFYCIYFIYYANINTVNCYLIWNSKLIIFGFWVSPGSLKMSLWDRGVWDLHFSDIFWRQLIT